MKILFDHQIFSTHQYGGIARYFCELIDNLNLHCGQDVKVFAPFFTNEYLEKSKSFAEKGIRVPSMFGQGRYFAWGLSTALATIGMKAQKNVDIFHETYYSSLDFCPPFAKRVITIHDMIHEKTSFASTWGRATVQAKAKAIIRADHIICVSENTRTDLLEVCGVPRGKTSVVYHGSFSLPTRLNGLKVNPLVLYVGKRDGYKNFAVLATAYASSQALRARFPLACFGGRPFSSREKEFFRRLGLKTTEVIHYPGDDHLLPDLYHAAAVFVYPSLYEGFGIPPLEAMASGCPVVCSNRSSLPEVVGDAAELFNPTDASQLAVAIEKIAFSPEKRQTLIDRGYQRVQQFSWEKCARETLAVYEKLSQI